MEGERSPDGLKGWRNYIPFIFEEIDPIGLFSIRCDKWISVKCPSDDAAPEIMGLKPVYHKALCSVPASAADSAVN